jgi:hypothetical protein
MAWFEDLSPYTYFPGFENCLCVGWLNRDHPFPRGPVARAFVNELQRLSKNVVNVTRGFHECQFCTSPSDPVGSLPARPEVLSRDRCGNGELHIVGETRVTYAAPVLVLHYIAEHQYQPPEEFIQAVLFQQRLRMEGSAPQG